MDLYVIDRDSADVRSMLNNTVSATWSRRYWEPGTLELGLETGDLAAAGIVKDETAIVVPDPAGPLAYLVEQVEVNEQSAASSMPVRITGRDFGLFFSERLVVPPGGQAQRKVTSVSAEEAMTTYVDTACGPSAPTERQFPRFTVAASQDRGATLTFGARYSMVSDTLRDLAMLSGLGWEVVWDPEENTYTFVVIEGVERGLEADPTDQVALDPDLETTSGMRWLSTVLGRKSHATIGGADEGAARTIRERWTGGSEPAGFDRREVFLDARDLGDDDDQLDARADARLAETNVPDRFEVDLNPAGFWQYPEAFDLGDLLLIRSTRYGVAEDARVTGIVRGVGGGGASLGGGLGGGQATPGSSILTTIELGDRWPTFRDRLTGPASTNPNLGATRT